MSDAWTDFWAGVTVLDLVAWIVGGILVITFAIKGWPALKGLVRLVDSLQALPAFMTQTTATLKEQDVKIQQIHHEVNYNNGSSVKDAVHRVELGVKGLYEITDELERTQPRPPIRKRTTKPKTP